MSLFLMFIALGFSFSSCKDDNDEPSSSGYYDFSIVWDVVDKGDYTTAEALSTIADLTEDSENILRGYTEADAKEYFEEFCQRMRYQIATKYKKITLRASLVRNEGNKVIARKTFYVDPNGTTIKAPVRSGDEIVIVQ